MENRFFSLPPGTLSAAGDSSEWIFAATSRLFGYASNLVGGFRFSSRSTSTALFIQDLKHKREGGGKNCTANPTLVSHLLLVYSPLVPLRTKPVRFMLIASDRRRSLRECVQWPQVDSR